MEKLTEPWNGQITYSRSYGPKLTESVYLSLEVAASESSQTWSLVLWTHSQVILKHSGREVLNIGSGLQTVGHDLFWCHDVRLVSCSVPLRLKRTREVGAVGVQCTQLGYFSEALTSAVITHPQMAVYTCLRMCACGTWMNTDSLPWLWVREPF